MNLLEKTIFKDQTFDDIEKELEAILKRLDNIENRGEVRHVRSVTNLSLNFIRLAAERAKKIPDYKIK